MGLIIGPRGFRRTDFSFGILVAATDVLQWVFFFGKYPTVTRDSKAGSIQLIPIANKPNSPWKRGCKGGLVETWAELLDEKCWSGRI